ncbi:MAG: DNA topology modulation protein [Gemmatimonadaceae bacterium]
MRKALIIGSAGAGKSTLAAQLSEQLGLPIIHLDALFWQPGWRETPRDVWKARVAELLERESWIMDGNYGGTLEERVRAADTVILLDLSRVQCLYRVIRRSIRHRGRARADLNPECPEQLPDWEFVRWIWNYPKKSLPRVLELLGGCDQEQRVIILRSPTEVRDFLVSHAGSRDGR